MELVVTTEKEIGETPLAALERFKREQPEYASLPGTYAGRLDPMAEGKLILLFGEECKNREKYLRLDKEYEVEILFSVGSDTGDVLGVVDSGELVVGREGIREALQKEVGSFEREYPVFSSKTVNGKPLFLYALEGTHDAIEIPKHTERIDSIDLLSVEKISHTALSERITSLLARAPKSEEHSKALGADFRIKDVRSSWERVFEIEQEYTVAKIRVACGSGTYMRSLAQRIGEALGTKALALSIHRTKIG